MALFVFSHTTAGASVWAYVYFMDDEIKVEPFQFSLGNSIRLMWKGHSFFLAVLIVVLSGAWPYIKNLILLLTWEAPVPGTHRSRWIYWMDLLGKYSLIDAIVLILMMAGFSMHIGTPDGQEAIPDGFVAIDV